MLMGKPMRVVWHNKDVATDKGNSNLFIKGIGMDDKIIIFFYNILYSFFLII